MTAVRRGDPVEFTRQRQAHHMVGEGEFGIATEDERPDGTVLVELADRTTYLVRHLVAYAWAGWLPDELEPVWERYNPEPDSGEDYP